MALKSGVAGMQEALDFINENREVEGGLVITTQLYSKSAYWHKNLELKISVQMGNTTKYFHVDWENPGPEEDNTWPEYPLEATAPKNCAMDLYDLYKTIEEDITPDTHIMLMYLFDEVCRQEAKQYARFVSEDNGYNYITKLEDAKDIEANTDGILPFDYVKKYNELDAHLEELTEYPPEEVKDIDTFVANIRDLNASKTVIVDIDYNLDATLIIIQAEDRKSFSVGVDLVPDVDFDEEEINVATYYLMAMFNTAVADITKYEGMTNQEVRQCDRMMLEFQTNSAAEEVAKSTPSTTVVKTVSTATVGSTFRPATYDGVSKPASTGTVSGGKGKKNKGKHNKQKSKDPFPDYDGGNDADYPRSGDLFGGDAYPYD